MPLKEKDIQKQVKKGPEEKKEFEKKFESKEAVKKAELTDTGLKEKLKNGIKDEKWSSEDIKKVDTFLEQAPVLKEDLHITVRMTDSYKKEDTNKKETKDNNKVTTISNEFYTTENLSSNLENLRANEELIQIQIPAGERVGYFTGETAEDTRILLRKNAAYQIDEMDGKTKTVIKGKMRVVWKAKLIKNKSENTPKDTPKDPNTTFNAEAYGEKWIRKLTTKEKEAMKKYTETNSGMFGKKNLYTAINTYLRTGEILKGYSENQLKEQVTFMDKAIHRASLSEDIKVYRLSEAVEFPNLTVGEINIDKAYRSTSLNRDVSGNSLFQKRPIRVEITIPKGTHAPYLDSITQVQGEKEILLPRGAKLKITGTSTVQETRTILNSETGKREPKLINILVIQATVVN
ncbi:hypothetical protein CN339_11415 [Bacillus thuringiensis]|nr:hypothetical protein CN339_11415 [Bacillus thuringiensis]